MKGLKFVFALALTFFPVVNLHAQNQHQNQARGFNANNVYSSYEIDHINNFNGNLTVVIPIGQQYPVNGNLSYSLKLIYNSNAWSPREVCPNLDVSTDGFFSPMPRIVGRDNNGDPVYYTEPAASNTDDPYGPREPRGSATQCWTIQDPNPGANAGLGWQLTMGKIYRPRADVLDDRPDYTEKSEWVYMSPDGSEHTFYHTLHEDDPPGGSSNIWYTRDGSYLRLNTNPVEQSKGDMLIEFPNGEKHYFRSILVRVGSGQFSEIREEDVSRIEDQFGNYVKIDYLDEDQNGLPDDKWVITDSLNRTQTMTFASPVAGYPKALVDVALKSFGSLPDAHYSLTYASRTITRPTPHVPPGVVQGYDDSVNVNFLESVRLPDGSQYTMRLDDNSYFLPTVDSRSPGILQKLILPTGGSIQWKYEAENPAADLDAGFGYRFGLTTSARHYLRSTTGVRQRIVTEGSNVYTWSYDPRLSDRVPDGCNALLNPNTCAPAEFVNTVTTPEGAHTRYYFSVWPFPLEGSGAASLRRLDPSAPHLSDYGLPFTKDARRPNLYFSPNQREPVKSTNDNTGRPVFLSQAIYDAAWKLKRTIYLRYENDQLAPGNGFGSSMDSNARVSATRTVYDDDNGIYEETQYSNFDGLGHYRKVETFGSFGAGDRRFEATGYNPNPDGTYDNYYIDPAANQPGTGHTYHGFYEFRPWILDTYDYKTASDFSQRSTTYFNFNGLGQLVSKRMRKDLETANTAYLLGSNDVLVTYGYDASGNLTSETYFGGDRPGHLLLDRNNKFPDMSSSPGEYKINYGHQCKDAGGATRTMAAISTKAYRGAAFYSTDNTIDCNTGAIKASRDSSSPTVAGLQTSYEYDSMGHVTYIKHAQGGYDEITYQPHTPNTPALSKVLVQHRVNEDLSGSDTIADEAYIYDQLGRLIVEKKRQPGGGQNYLARNRGYNGMGWPTFVSEWIPENSDTADKKTLYQNYDPFGNATKITLPDKHVTTIFRLGARQVTRTVSIGTQIDSTGKVTEQDSVTKEFYDGQGRLNMVTEPSGAGGLDINWGYWYDVNNNLVVVSSTDTSPNMNVQQGRSFNYDNLGNLISESNPERPWAQYTGYDTMGNVGAAYDGAHWLNYSYDNAGRVTSLTEPDGSPLGRAVKDYVYDSAQGFGLGKLATATRHNWVLNPYETPQNVALGKAATQSSTLFGADASRAVDGNTSGNFGNLSTTHTDNNAQSWWQVDLGGSYALDQIRIWNRTDCCSDRLSNFYVLISDQPFTSTDLNTARNQAGVSSYNVSAQGGAPTTLGAGGRTGRYVRVQLAGTNFLSLAEVQVFGVSPAPVDVSIREEYSYTGLDGRLGKQVTKLNSANPAPSIFEQTFAYDQLGNIQSQSYPQCLNATCANATPTLGSQSRPRVVHNNYDQNWLSSVGATTDPSNNNYASSITYNLNGTVQEIVHGNNVKDTFAQDANYMERPASIRVQRVGAAAPYWDSGAFKYDGASNITNIGADWYLYDRVNRVVEGSAMSAGMKKQYSYDAFGNMLTIKTYTGVTTPTNGTRLLPDYSTNARSDKNQFALNYDGAGNTLGLVGQPPLYTYDSLNMIKSTPNLTYLYGPDDERVWMVDRSGNRAAPADTVWVEDGLPSGASASGGWNWVTSNPTPFSGSAAHQTSASSSAQQQFFTGATNTLNVNAGDKLVAYVYLDPISKPTEVMLQWYEGSSWEHRAYWGADDITAFGTRYRAGDLPAAGKWVRLEVPASQVGLEGKRVSGMAFTLSNGKASFDHAGKSAAPLPVVETITLRGAGNEVLREYQVTGGNASGNWRWTKDYIYASGKLLASESPGGGVRHYHLDQLGTPRAITDAVGNPVNGATYQYFPFGEEATMTPPPDERLRFTGHERDNDGTGITIDYMHARFYNPQGGKFLSVDPGRSFKPENPQSWNLYTYVLSNPISHVDPDGRETMIVIRNRGKHLNAGHVAYRVWGKGYDYTFSFGGWHGINFRTGNAQGGVQVWTDFNAYLKQQESRGSAIKGLKLGTTQAQDLAAIAYFFDKIQAAGTQPVEVGAGYNEFRTRMNYNLYYNNCLLTSVEALKDAQRKTGTPIPALKHLEGKWRPLDVFTHLDKWFPKGSSEGTVVPLKSKD